MDKKQFFKILSTIPSSLQLRKKAQEKEYSIIDFDNVVSIAENYIHNPKIWLKIFSEYSKNVDRQGLSAFRILIIHQTLAVIQKHNGFYICDDETLIQLDLWKIQFSPNSSRMYLSGFQHSTSINYELPSKVLIFEGDCVETSIYLKGKHFLKNVTILNMANKNHPGGGFMHGAGAQEENLHRRSTMYLHTANPDHWGNNNVKYPLDNPSGGIYSGHVLFFRGPESRGYEFLKDPELFSVVSVAAENKPVIFKDKKKDEWRLSKEAEQDAYERIKAIFEISIENHSEALVLSAFGCGAFRNPPRHIAELFQRAYEKYKHKFKIIAFSIFDDHNSRKEHNPEGNVKPFVDTFGKEVFMGNIEKYLYPNNNNDDDDDDKKNENKNNNDKKNKNDNDNKNKDNKNTKNDQNSKDKNKKIKF